MAGRSEVKHGSRSVLEPRPEHPAGARAAARLSRDWVGWVGLAIGLLAMTLALIPSWLAPLYDPPAKPVQQRAADWLSELKDRAAAAIKMEPAPPPPPEVRNPWRDPRIALASLICGFGALVLGILAFVLHEEQRLVACCVALGAGTIAAQYLLTAALILGFAVLVGVVLARTA